MKRIILFLFFTLCNITYSQNEPCAYYGIQESIAARMSNFNNSNLVIDNPLTPMVFNIKINIFNRENGTNWCTRNNIPFGDQQFQEIVKDLNINFNQFNIFFKYRGFQIYGGNDGNGHLTMIENSTDNVNGVYARQNQMVDLCDKDVINLNFVDQLLTPFNTITNELQHTYQNVKAIANIGRSIIIFSLPSYFGVKTLGNGSANDLRFDKNFVICHEMGHTLGLSHIFENFKEITNPIFPTFISENVTRITTDPLFNATFAGDMIPDTPAVGNFHYTRYSTDNCHAIPNQTTMSQNVDINGTYLDFENILYGNFMSYSYDDVGTDYNHTNCLALNPNKYSFTAGQGSFMRNYILNNVPAALVVGNTGILTVNITQTITTVESLYQPYSRDYVAGEVVVSTTDNGDGTAKVCRNILAQDRFQMGFNYLFPENDATVDITSATILQIPIVSHHTSDYPITIAQLAPGQTNLITNTVDCLLSCTRGVICVDEAYIGGIIISAEELLNMNVTIEQLNAIQVKDPELFDKLISQRYYKLKKETATGAKTEEVFYKQ